jgi:Domain of unknown function (DUF4126)
MPDNVEPWQVMVGVVTGVGIAAATGFRVFLPLLVMALAARFGGLQLTSGFDWVTSNGAIIALATAAVVEIGAFYIPWVDNALDAVAAPASVLAGTLAVASQAGSSDPWMNWVVGLIAGGGTAGVVQLGTMALRGVSLVATGGLANPIVATIENAAAFIVALLAVLVPILAIIAVGVIVFIIARRVRQRKQARAALAAA